MSYNVTDTTSGHVDFSSYCREHLIATPLNRVSKVEEVELQLYCSPAVLPSEGVQPFGGGEDFRLYVNEHNVTDQVLESLRQLIRALPVPLVRTQYIAGVRRYLEFALAFADPPPVEEELAVAQEYAEMDDWGDAFQSLGDRNVGWSGNLHVLHYVYRFIPLLPISLNDVWRRYREATDPTLPDSLKRLQHLQLTFSQGPAPTHENVDPAAFIPGGRLYYQVEYGIKNPLHSTLQQMNSRLRNLASQLESLRTNYLDELAAAMHTIEGSFEEHENSTAAALHQIREAVDNISE